MARLKKERTEQQMEKIQEIWAIVVASIVILGIVAILLCIVINRKKSLPSYEEQIVTYEVVSVYKYVRNETNIWGGVIDTDICYNFSYISNGNLYHIEDFIHYDYGLTKVIVGTSDCYIVNKYTDERYLQLTKETLRSLSGTSE